MNEYDFAVIGGGSAGYNAAATAARLGLRTVVVDGAEELGGLCILRGCMPSKTLIESANRHLAFRHAAEFGLHVGEYGFSAPEIQRRKRRLVAEFADYRRKQLENGSFDFVHGRGAFVDEHTLKVTQGDGSRRTLRSRTFLVATGSKIHEIDLPGLQETGYLSSDAVLEMEAVPKSLVVLGGGATALEFAHYYSALGSSVTVIQRSTQLLREADADVVQALVESLSERGVRFFCNTRLLRAERSGSGKRVWFEHAGAEVAVEAEEIVYALGRKPLLEGLRLAAAGISAEPQLLVNASQQTSQSHIFAAGDAVGPYEIVHIAIQQGEMAARNAARFLRGEQRLEVMDYRLKLFAVFSEPQLATVGFTEKELLNAGVPYVAAQYPFVDHGKSIVMGAMHGFVKLLAHERTGEILGAAVVGPEGAELIHEIVVAMHFKATAKELLGIPHYHPTLSEIWTYPAEELASLG